ncbi:hypothetical protein [Actinoplanes sp. URMC 104]|uniref:hypothetical protein n=1 Tax=Actinoplanes sp. URMC 104 TaxID=3423409 RepID=UPI003F1D5190
MASDQDRKSGADAAEYRFVAVLSSGEYEDHRIHCVFEDPADAEHAADALNAELIYPEFSVERLPVVPAGRVPRKTIVYTMAVDERRNLAQGLDPVLVDSEVWEWEAPAFDDTGHRANGELYRARGTDPDRVRDAVLERLAQERLNHA